MARWKQRQILPCVDKQRSAAVKVKATDTLTENALIMATGVSGAHMTVELADANDFGEVGGTLWVADFAVAAGKTVACAVPWKLVTGINTLAAEAVGQPVFLSSDGTGTYTLTPTANAPHIKVGHVVADHATLGAILLNPGAYSGQIAGQLTFSGSATTATVVVGAAYDGLPVLATLQNSTSGDAHVETAIVAGGTLTIEVNSTTAGGTVTYMIIG